jgi:hypothetical protein
MNITKVPTIEEAIEASEAIAAQHGIVDIVPEILHAAGNIWIHLAPHPIVAQIPKDVVTVRGPSTIVHLTRDLEVCAWLADKGCPVGAPSSLFPPGPYEHNGVAVTFYRHYRRSETKDDVAAGKALRECHEALAEYPGSLTKYEALIDEPQRLLGMLQAGRLLAPAQITLLRDRLQSAERQILSWPVQPVHGDVHLQNVLWSAKQPLWTDWEDVCQAPLLWDLACLFTSTLLYGIPKSRLDDALKGYGTTSLDLREMQPFVHARIVQVSAWAATRAAHDPKAAKRLKDGLHWLRYHHL